MEPALIEFLQARFGAAEAARIVRSWLGAFGRLFDGQAGAPDVPDVPDRHQEYDDLLRLLLEHAVDARQSTAAVARWIAFSCMGENHLWEDLALADRPELTRLMADLFPRLRALNSANMRWKKFFYKQLCERAEVFACRSPSCDLCSEYDVCFGPELARAAGHVECAVPSHRDISHGPEMRHRRPA
jgi:nitrogen fixation protein NifQ